VNEGCAASCIAYARDAGGRWVVGAETGWRQGFHGTSTMKPRILEESYVLALMEGSASAMSLKYATFSTSCYNFSWTPYCIEDYTLTGIPFLPEGLGNAMMRVSEIPSVVSCRPVSGCPGNKRLRTRIHELPPRNPSATPRST